METAGDNPKKEKLSEMGPMGAEIKSPPSSILIST
jgi:hypothetical protein